MMKTIYHAISLSLGKKQIIFTVEKSSYNIDEIKYFIKGKENISLVSSQIEVVEDNHRPL